MFVQLPVSALECGPHCTLRLCSQFKIQWANQMKSGAGPRALQVLKLVGICKNTAWQWLQERCSARAGCNAACASCWQVWSLQANVQCAMEALALQLAAGADAVVKGRRVEQHCWGERGSEALQGYCYEVVVDTNGPFKQCKTQQRDIWHRGCRI
jgi:hypothetical protein